MLDHLEDNIHRVIADIRPQMLEKVIENWTSRLDYIRASNGSPMPEIIFKITTKNIHSTIVEDRKAREKKQEEQQENLRIEEQKEKLRIEEREEKLRIEQLRLHEQKRKDEFELEKLR
ncbi:hypothetical protein TNCV_992381 [Trichonephila clavipes]|nr:hypothetical protein TNCV_992381 [Trichonephila clavipes]